MFDLSKAIAAWRRQMAAGGIQSPELLDELESHLRESVAHEMQSGASAQAAFESAVRQIGQAHALKCEFEKVGGAKGLMLQKLKALLLGLLRSPQAIPFPSLDNFNSSARQTLDLARAEAPRFHHDFIGTEHVLLGLLALETGPIPSVLRKLGVKRETIRAEIEKVVGVGPARPASPSIPYTPRARKALLLAAQEAKTLNHSCVGTEHIFLGLLMEGSGVAALVLKNLGIQIEQTRREIIRELEAE